MRRPTMGVLVASLLRLVASMTTTVAQSSPSAEPSARTVEVPGAGATVTLPREWRTWVSEDDGRPPGVWTTDLAPVGPV